MAEYFAYFGFGSLVNRNTLPENLVDAVPTKLKGWRRHWQARPINAATPARFHSLALLSIHRDPACNINGLVIIDRIENQPALRQREHAYQNVTLQSDELEIDGSGLVDITDIPVHVHMSPDNSSGNSPTCQNSKKPISILRSYLDVVMQGYLREFGEAGLGEFMATTKGFELPIVEDRAAPVYSRHQVISRRETAIFDGFVPGSS